MFTVSVQEIKDSVKSFKIYKVLVRKCNICFSPLWYYFSQDFRDVKFDPNCHCPAMKHPLRISSYDEIVELINSQESDPQRLKIATLFGVTLESHDSIINPGT